MGVLDSSSSPTVSFGALAWGTARWARIRKPWEGPDGIVAGTRTLLYTCCVVYSHLHACKWRLVQTAACLPHALLPLLHAPPGTLLSLSFPVGCRSPRLIIEVRELAAIVMYSLSTTPALCTTSCSTSCSWS